MRKALNDKVFKDRAAEDCELGTPDFSKSIIRGKNFASASFRETTFVEAIGGLRQSAAVLALGGMLLLLMLLGATLQTGMSLTIPSLEENLLGGLTYLLLLIVFFAAAALRGLTVALQITSTAIVVSVVIAGVVFQNETLMTIESGAVTASIPLIVAVPGISAIAILSAAAVILFKSPIIAATITFTVGGAVALALSQDIGSVKYPALGIVAVIALLGAYIAIRGLADDPEFAYIRPIAIAIATLGGTSFREANLTDADFTRASLKSTDFRGANLTRTRWFQAQGLDVARVGDSYLQYLQIQKLVTTLQGQSQNFSKLLLTGINLSGANLQDANFTSTDLNYANLRAADFSRAILKQAQLDGADLTGAILTGAYIEDWGITGETNLDDVQCDYIFMRLPTPNNPNPLRKPDNWQAAFKAGEFADFIKPYVDTLDLYHSQDVDPRAISIAFKNLSKEHPEANLQIVAMEKRGQSSFNIKVKAPPAADKSELSAEYFETYNYLKALPSAAKLVLAEKDARIRSLEDMISTAIQQPTFSVQGDLAMTEQGINISSGGNIGDISGLVGGDVSGVVNLGTVSGNVTNAIDQLPDAPQSAQYDLKTLFKQLQQAIQDDADLSNPDKADLLDQVQVLAEAEQAEVPEKKEGVLRRATKIFEATLNSLPDTAKIVETCGKLLPLILKVMGSPV